MGVMTPVGASVALQGVPGVRRLLHPHGAACRCAAFASRHSHWENHGGVGFFFCWPL